MEEDAEMIVPPRILFPSLHDRTRHLILILLKIVKIMETFAFEFCTLWVHFSAGEGVQAARKTKSKEV